MSTRAEPDRAVLAVIECLVLVDGRRLGEALEPWQREHVLRPILARRRGLPLCPLCYIEILKGGAKSTVGAGVGVGECAAHPGTWVDIAAVDTDQGDIVLGYAAGFCARTPALRRHAKILKGKILFDNGSVLQVLSSDEPSAHGGGGRGRRYRVILDEFALWPDLALAHALLASTGKVKDSQVLVLSNPGSVKAGEAWRLREQARAGKHGWYLYAPEDSIAPGWITDSWREQMKEALPPQLYERFIRGRWSDGPDTFLTREQILACVDPSWMPQTSGPTPVYVACDLGLRRDRTAIAVVGWQGDRLALMNLGVADPEARPDGEVLIEAVETELLRIAEAFPVRKVLLDPWNLASSRQRLQARLPIEDFPYVVSNQERVSKTLYSLIASKRLRLYRDEALIDELTGLQTVVTPKGFRFDHHRGGYSDRCVALGMACWAACESGPSRAISAADFHFGGRRSAATLLGAGRPGGADVWVAAGRRADRDWADEVQEGPTGAHWGGRAVW